MAEQRIGIRTDHITLDAFLKWAGAVETGGQAKALIAAGQVKVNGETEFRRGRKLHPGDRIRLAGGGEWLLTRGEE